VGDDDNLTFTPSWNKMTRMVYFNGPLLTFYISLLTLYMLYML